MPPKKSKKSNKNQDWDDDNDTAGEFDSYKRLVRQSSSFISVIQVASDFLKPLLI